LLKLIFLFAQLEASNMNLTIFVVFRQTIMETVTRVMKP